MNLQRRIADAQRESLIRSVDRDGNGGGWLRRVMGKAPRVRVLDAAALKPLQEDFAHALKF